MTRCGRSGRDGIRRLALMVCAIVLLWQMPSTEAQSVTVIDMVGQKSEWPAWAKEERRVILHGRFHGRTADTFKLDKFELPCRLTSGAKLPDRMRNGQRVELSGRMITEDGRILIQVSRVLVRDTDSEHLSRLASTLAATDADGRLKLAADFQATADFYGDRALADGITELRNQAVSLKRLSATGDLSKLQEVLEVGQSLAVDPRILDVIRYEMLITRWKQTPPDRSAVLEDLREANQGWDRQVPDPPQKLVAGFAGNPVDAYEQGSDDDRRWLHRLLFQTVRIEDLKSQLNPDGSNGLLLAEMVRREFPTQDVVAEELEQREISYRLKHVSELSRRDLQQLHELLTRKGQTDRTRSLIQEWLSAQEQKFGSNSIGALLRTADEYLFAAEFARHPEDRETGVELLKRAWQRASTESPDDATQIAERLRSLGWDRLNDQWMTIQQLEQLPRNDVELAAREGRVVVGMTPEQVVQTLGQPERITRIGSAGQLREIWIFSGDVGLVIRFHRPLTSTSNDRVVEDVSRLRGLIR